MTLYTYGIYQSLDNSCDSIYVYMELLYICLCYNNIYHNLEKLELEMIIPAAPSASLRVLQPVLTEDKYPYHAIS